VAEKKAQEFFGESCTYYGPCMNEAGDMQPCKKEDPVLVEWNASLDDEQAEIKLLSSKLHAVLQSTERMELELEKLDTLSTKWTEASIEVFREIQKGWNEPIRLQELARSAGFDPDDFEIDYDDVNMSEAREPGNSTKSSDDSEF